MAILTEYSLWLLPLCLLAGAGFSLLLYYKNRNLDLTKKTTVTLSVIRGLVVALICFLLLAPMLKMILKKVEKPILVVAVDDTESIASTKDSAFYRTEFSQKLNRLIASFGDRYEIRPYLIGEDDQAVPADEEIELDFCKKESDLSSIFDDIEKFYSGKNIGAMLMFTDGIYNKGENPYYKAEKVKFPVYTVGLGDTDLQRDLLIAGIAHNQQTYKGNFSPVEIKVSATKLAGKKAALTVTDENENVIYQKQIAVSGPRHFETVRFTVEIKENGIHRYKVQLDEIEGEITHKNNASHFFIEGIESKEKIAILYNSPHPDISAIKQALEISDKYEVEAYAANKFKGNPGDYSLIILHQLPAKTNSASNLIGQIQKKGIAVLYILGQQTNLSNFNTLHSGLSIVQNKNLTNDASPAFNENFASFNFSEGSKTMLKNYPPLQTFFGEYKASVSANIFLYQQIGTVKTSEPLILFNEINGVRNGIVTGTGLWQWRLYDYLYNENHEAFDDLINQMALYLSVKSDKSFFRIASKNIYNENEPVEFSAELYNDSYELITEPDISIKITGEDKKQYDALFSKQNNGYYLNMGELPTGNYAWSASVKNGNKLYKKSGSFTIRELVVETQNLVADHQLLQNIAQTTNGQFLTVEEMDKLTELIKINDEIKSTASYEKQYAPILNSWLYFALLMILFATEWFLRKWNGGY